MQSANEGRGSPWEWYGDLRERNAPTRRPMRSIPAHFSRCSHASYMFPIKLQPPAHLELVELHMMHCKAPTLSAVVATKYVVVQCTAQCTAHMSLFIFVSVIVDEYASDGVWGLPWQTKGADWLCVNWLLHRTHQPSSHKSVVWYFTWLLVEVEHSSRFNTTQHFAWFSATPYCYLIDAVVPLDDGLNGFHAKLPSYTSLYTHPSLYYTTNTFHFSTHMYIINTNSNVDHWTSEWVR